MIATTLTVGRTYTSRWIIRLGFVVGLIWLALMLAVAVPNFAESVLADRYAPFQTMALMLPAALLANLLTTQAKWQFAHSRARLLPRFAVPHLTWIIAPLLLVGIIVPLYVAIQSGASAIGILALTGASMALGVWGVHNPSAWTWLLLMILMFSSYTARASQFFLSPLEPFAAAHWPLALVSWALVVMWLVRLPRMREEDDDYIIPVAQQTGKLSRIEKSEQRRLIARFAGKRGVARTMIDRRFTQLAVATERTDAEKMRLVELPQSPMPAPLMALWFALLFPAIVVGSALVMGQVQLAQMGGMVGSQASIFGLMGGILGAQQLLQRRPQLASELLLPLTREQFVDALFIAVARTTLWITGAFMLTTVVVLVSLAPDFLSIHRIVCGLAAMIATSSILLGINLRLVLYDGFATRMVAMIGTMWGGMAILAAVYFLGELAGVIPCLLLATLLTWMGWRGIRWARGAWLQAELG